MTKLYIAETDCLLNEEGKLIEEIIKRAGEILPSYRMERVARFRYEKDRARSLLAGLLLLESLRDYCGDIQLAYPKISYGSNEKPFLTGKENLHFNLSHSGNYVVCAVAEAPVGVDVQEVKHLKQHFITRVFSEGERAYAEKLSQETSERFYIDLYALKEAYVKYTGEGMRRRFEQLDVLTLYQGKTALLDGKRMQAFRTEELPGYSLALVQETAEEEVIIKKVTQLSCLKEC